ncbi:serine hydrolase [Martelella limonii]|uniref:serine hydrolase n=1 Tax=Martelella limonii TaxID=1647649 RepID=UPI003CC806E9
MHTRIGPVTKTFTVTALLQLVEEGKVSLDDTIDQYVDGVPNGDRATMRQLANMTSGVLRTQIGACGEFLNRLLHLTCLKLTMPLRTTIIAMTDTKRRSNVSTRSSSLNGKSAEPARFLAGARTSCSVLSMAGRPFVRSTGC